MSSSALRSAMRQATAATSRCVATMVRNHVGSAPATRYATSRCGRTKQSFQNESPGVESALECHADKSAVGVAEAPTHGSRTATR